MYSDYLEMFREASKRHMLIIQRNPYHLLYPSWQMYLFLLCNWNEYSLKLAYIPLPFM